MNYIFELVNYEIEIVNAKLIIIFELVNYELYF